MQMVNWVKYGSSHGLRNEVTPWRESAPQPLCSPHAPKGSGSCRPAERWDSPRDALLEKDGPN